MAEVEVGDLRNHGGEILNRVAAGEAFVVTRHGEPIAELRPRPRRPVPSGQLLLRWRRLPAVNPALLRADIHVVLDGML